MAREPGPHHVAGQQQASRAVSQAVRAEGQRRVTPGQAPQGMLTLQKDEVDWGSEASDPALQHALAVIQAKGEKRNETTQTDYAFWLQFNEKPNMIPGCPGKPKVTACSSLNRYRLESEHQEHRCKTVCPRTHGISDAQQFCTMHD